MDKDMLRSVRNNAVSFNIHLDDKDEIVRLISIGSNLYVISKFKIIRIRSPDDLDPHLNHQTSPWEQSIVLPFGESDPVVSKTIIGSLGRIREKFSESSEEYFELANISWEVMYSIISLRVIHERLENEIESAKKEILANLDLYTNGLSPKPLPIVKYYDIEFRGFINEVKRCLLIISKLFDALSILKFGTKHTAYKKEFSKGNFHKAQAWADVEMGHESSLFQLLNNDMKWIELWIDMRNALEHPKDGDHIETFNFYLEADRTIHLPTWRFISNKYDDLSKPQKLLDSFGNCYENLLGFYENLLSTLITI